MVLCVVCRLCASYVGLTVQKIGKMMGHISLLAITPRIFALNPS